MLADAPQPRGLGGGRLGDHLKACADVKLQAGKIGGRCFGEVPAGLDVTDSRLRLVPRVNVCEWGFQIGRASCRERVLVAV